MEDKQLFKLLDYSNIFQLDRFYESNRVKSRSIDEGDQNQETNKQQGNIQRYISFSYSSNSSDANFNFYLKQSSANLKLRYKSLSQDLNNRSFNSFFIITKQSQTPKERFADHFQSGSHQFRQISIMTDEYYNELIKKDSRHRFASSFKYQNEEYSDILEIEEEKEMEAGNDPCNLYKYNKIRTVKSPFQQELNQKLIEESSEEDSYSLELSRSFYEQHQIITHKQQSSTSTVVINPQKQNYKHILQTLNESGTSEMSQPSSDSESIIYLGSYQEDMDKFMQDSDISLEFGYSNLSMPNFQQKSRSSCNFSSEGSKSVRSQHVASKECNSLNRDLKKNYDTQQGVNFTQSQVSTECPNHSLFSSKLSLTQSIQPKTQDHSLVLQQKPIITRPRQKSNISNGRISTQQSIISEESFDVNKLICNSESFSQINSIYHSHQSSIVQTQKEIQVIDEDQQSKYNSQSAALKQKQNNHILNGNQNRKQSQLEEKNPLKQGKDEFKFVSTLIQEKQVLEEKKCLSIQRMNQHNQKSLITQDQNLEYCSNCKAMVPVTIQIYEQAQEIQNQLWKSSLLTVLCGIICCFKQPAQFQNNTNKRAFKKRILAKCSQCSYIIKKFGSQYQANLQYLQQIM